MERLLALPDDILTFVLLPFISVRDLCCMDVAITNRILRPLLLDCYSRLKIESIKGNICITKMRWICGRNINVDKLTFQQQLPSLELTEIFKMVQRCPAAAASITSIDFTDCVKSVYPSHLMQIFKSCENLSTVSLPGYKKCWFLDSTHHLTLPSLTDLNLSKCSEVNALLAQISNLCCNLTSLSLKSCNSLNNRSITGLAQGCPALTTVDLCRCEKLTDAALISLSQHCAKLSCVNLTRLHKITDAGIEAVALRCVSLRSLNVYACAKLTDASLLAISLHCNSLSDINLGKCKDITRLAITRLAETLQDLVILT